MTTTETETKPQATTPAAMPFVAPCRTLDLHAPFRWLERGWADLKRAPRQSLTYGLAIVVLSYLITALAWKLGTLALLLGVVSGFVFLGPVLAVGLYSISCQLQLGRTPQLGYCLREGRRHLGNELIFAMILTVVFLVWARAASMVHIFFPTESDTGWQALLAFLGVGTLVGSIFAAVIFIASAFSLPMIMDRKVDVVTAIITSANAVLRNKGPMLLWAAIIAATVAAGVLTAYFAFIALIPLIGHATWHAYKDTIIADDWPRHAENPE
ncbi:MAG: DUF2189 domain-containing protein [Thiotrichales bacterium]